MARPARSARRIKAPSRVTLRPRGPRQVSSRPAGDSNPVAGVYPAGVARRDQAWNRRGEPQTVDGSAANLASPVSAA